jgi:DNA mismatch repair protein MutL
VVERPASALKELVENSLDAGARAVSIELERGGLGLIMVTDNGCGMGREDALLSLRRHATSKVRDASDLAAIRTLGFRGEALASIASVSELRMQTRRSHDEFGTELTANGGEIAQTRTCAQAAGTRVEVRRLFFNTPARLKFMKTIATEQAAAAEILQRVALANRAVVFSFVADGRPVFELPRVASLLERMRQLYGAKLAAQMLPFEYRAGAVKVFGLTSMSQESFAAPRLILTYVNRRPVRDRMLTRAIGRAYESLLPRGRHPAVALFIDLPHEEVDVNVHPMKTEVRFRRGGELFEVVYSALRERLKDQTINGSLASSDSQPAAPRCSPSGPDRGAAEHTLEHQAAIGVPPIGGQEETRRTGDASANPLRLIVDEPVSRAAQVPLGLGFGDRGHDVNGGVHPAGARVPRYSSLRVIGQFFAGFIALESDDGLMLVDQHAAHERVTFERLRAELHAGGIQIQPLLAAAPLELNPARSAQALAALPELRAMGFEVEPFGRTALLLKGAPAVFAAGDSMRLLSDMLDSMGDNGLRNRGEGAMEEWLKTLACHGSVRAGRVLEGREIATLLEELDRTEFKTNCPHGRPVHIEFRRGQLERMFRR